MTRVALALGLLGLLGGCGEDAEPAATEPVEAVEPTAPTGELRGPTGEAVDCSGAPDDPDEVDQLAQAAAAGDLAGSITGLEALCGAHPRSSSARVRLGELLLRTQPPRAEDAQGWFDRALALHERGCELGFRDHWAALEGQGLSRMIRGSYGDAIAPLRESLRRWPGSRATHYNLACALCQTGDLDGCARELETVLGPLEAPDFLSNDTRPPAHYRTLIERDPDLAPLRADATRYEALTARIGSTP